MASFSSSNSMNTGQETKPAKQGNENEHLLGVIE